VPVSELGSGVLAAHDLVAAYRVCGELDPVAEILVNPPPGRARVAFHSGGGIGYAKGAEVEKEAGPES